MSDGQVTEAPAAPTVDMDASTAETLAMLQQPTINDFQTYVDPTPLGGEERPASASHDDDIDGEAIQEPQEPAEGEEASEAKEGDEDAPEGSAASGWAKVRKRERKLREQAEQIKAQEQRIQQEAQRLEHMHKAVEDYRAKLKQDPLSALEEAGYTFETLAKRIIDGEVPAHAPQPGQSNPQIEAMAKQLQAMQERMNQREAALEAQGMQIQASQALQSEDFALLNTADDPVGEIITVQKHYQSQGQYISAHDAAQLLQKNYIDQLRKLGQNEHVRKILLGDAASQQSAGHSQAPQSKPTTGSPAKTLSNNMASAPMVPIDLDRTYTEAEEIAMALKQITGV